VKLLPGKGGLLFTGHGAHELEDMSSADTVPRLMHAVDPTCHDNFLIATMRCGGAEFGCTAEFPKRGNSKPRGEHMHANSSSL